jgi:aminopeptidase N
MFYLARFLVGSGILPLMAAPALRPYTVENYDASIQVDLGKQRLDGEVSIRLHSRVDPPISALELDAGSLRIMSVAEGQTAQYFERKGSTLVVVLTNPLHSDEHRTLTVRYQAEPSAGLKFFADQSYGIVTSDWMPSSDRPDERATLRLEIHAPQNAKVAASGHLVDTHAGEGQTITEWQLDSAASPAEFGFALGAFSESTSEAEGVKLRVLGTGSEIFEPTTAALRYFAEHTGKPYPGESYTQVFVHGNAVRAMAGGLSILPESYAKENGKDADSLWQLSSALAQQWYGIGIALKDWRDVWLSEGISAFLADEFVGQRLGKAAFDKQIAHSRETYNQLRAQDKDRPLSYADWTTREDADGEIPIHKGAWFLYLLHDMVQDDGFWAALKFYTNAEWGQPAASEDLQNAFHTVKGPARTKSKKRPKTPKGQIPEPPETPVDKLFDTWVYGVLPK